MTVEQGVILVAMGLCAGFVGGLFGIGGGVIIVPALYALFVSNGISETIAIKAAVGTSLATIIVTSIRSVQGHHRHGHVGWELLRTWAGWIALGAIGGALLARMASATFLTMFFGVSLLAIGLHKLLSTQRTDGHKPLPGVGVQRAIASTIGMVSSLLGIGGGVVGVLVLSRYGWQLHKAIGTAAGFGLAIAVPGTVGYILGGWGHTEGLFGGLGYVSMPAFAAIAGGTFIAAPWGVGLASRLSARRLNTVFSIYMIITSILMIKEAIAP